VARLIGINHIALEVADVEAALEFYGSLFDVRLRGRGARMAFIDAGDQFIALAETATSHRDGRRHFGLVVDDRDAVRAALGETDAELLPGRGLDFLDPWGNHVQVVDYREVQFTKSPEVLGSMGLPHLRKTPEALRELREKGIG
jgi:catechol 2,3-dioxygenase-like lactoylglutathione lyase family enzyme